MDEKLAKDVIKQAIAVAQKSGVYTLKDSTLIYQALLALGMADESEQLEEKETNESGK